jgi:hypothetical protein
VSKMAIGPKSMVFGRFIRFQVHFDSNCHNYQSIDLVDQPGTNPGDRPGQLIDN